MTISSLDIKDAHNKNKDPTEEIDTQQQKHHQWGQHLDSEKDSSK
jgi:hypothetical protein